MERTLADQVGRVSKLEDTVSDLEDIVEQLNEAPTQGTRGSQVH